VASLHCGFNAFGRMHSEIVGTQGLLLIPDTFLDDAGQLQLLTSKGSEWIDVAASDRYALEISDFSAAILENRAPALGIDESLRNMRTLERLIAARDKAAK
jgi:hypothetical protein